MHTRWQPEQRKWQHYRHLGLVATLLLTSLTIFISSSKQPTDYNRLDTVVLWFVAPIQQQIVGTIDSIGNLWSHYINLVDTAQTNDLLRMELDALKGTLSLREEQVLENERLYQLLKLRKRLPDAQTVVANVIAVAPSPLFRSLRIDRGTNDGVMVGNAVVIPAGVVGRVVAATSSWANVMLLVDVNSSTDVLIQRSRARARVRGKGRDGIMGIDLIHLKRTADVRPGDVVLTSGIGSVFPKGLIVGQIKTTKTPNFGLYQRVTVEPIIDFSTLEEVMVILQGWSRDIDISPISTAINKSQSHLAKPKSTPPLP